MLYTEHPWACSSTLCACRERGGGVMYLVRQFRLLKYVTCWLSAHFAALSLFLSQSVHVSAPRTSMWATQMNAALRKDDGADALEVWAEVALHLSRALAKLCPLNVPLYRGLSRRVSKAHTLSHLSATPSVCACVHCMCSELRCSCGYTGGWEGVSFCSEYVSSGRWVLSERTVGC